MNELSEKLIILYSTPDGVVGAVVSKMETAAGRIGNGVIEES